jgi:hypothetical protein
MWVNDTLNKKVGLPYRYRSLSSDLQGANLIVNGSSIWPPEK